MNDSDVVWMPLLFVGVPVAVAWAYALRLTIRFSRQGSRDAESARWRRIAAAVMLGLLLLAGFGLVALGPPWFRASVSNSFIRRTEIRMLGMVEIAYGAAVLIAAVSGRPNTRTGDSQASGLREFGTGPYAVSS